MSTTDMQVIVEEEVVAMTTEEVTEMGTIETTSVEAAAEVDTGK